MTNNNMRNTKVVTGKVRLVLCKRVGTQSYQWL